MKFLKKLFKVLIALVIVIILAIIIVIGLDSKRTNYLNIDNSQLAETDTYIIKNVNIIPMHVDTLLVNKNIYFKNGIIKEIADNIQINDVDIIEGQNKYLVPGLIDMHVHVWDRYELGLYLANGVTAVRNLWGMPMHLRIKEDIDNNEIISPSFYTSGPKLTGPEFIGDDNLNLTNPEEAKEKVIAYKERGYDFIKTYYGLTEDIFNAIIEQARISDIDIASHPSQKVPYSYHFNTQIKSIEHAEEIVQQPLKFSLDTVKLKQIVSNYAKNTSPSFCPTLVVFNNIYQILLDDNILESEELKFMNPLIMTVDSQVQFDRWQNTKQENPSVVNSIKKQHNFHLRIVKLLHDEGVNIICGTDAGIGVTLPGFSIHQELDFYIEAGLSNFEVLETATINAASTHEIMKNLGSVEEGKVANLLLLENNPLNDLSALKNPSLVFVKGRKIEKEILKVFIEKGSNRKNLMASAIRYLENLIIEK